MAREATIDSRDTRRLSFRACLPGLIFPQSTTPVMEFTGCWNTKESSGRSGFQGPCARLQWRRCGGHRWIQIPVLRATDGCFGFPAGASLNTEFSPARPVWTG